MSSKPMADTINLLTKPEDHLLLYGDQSDSSSIIFYTNRQALLVDGRRSTMLYGSYYPGAAKIFLTDSDLVTMWGAGPRNFLFVPEDSRDHVESLLGSRAIAIQNLW